MILYCILEALIYVGLLLLAGAIPVAIFIAMVKEDWRFRNELDDRWMELFQQLKERPLEEVEKYGTIETKNGKRYLNCLPMG